MYTAPLFVLVLESAHYTLDDNAVSVDDDDDVL